MMQKISAQMRVNAQQRLLILLKIRLNNMKIARNDAIIARNNAIIAKLMAEEKGAKMLNTTKTLKDDMLVGDLVDNHEFDINCNFEIYDCTKRGTDWNDGGKKIFSTIDDGWVIPGDKILEMRVQYMTLDLSRQAIVIEAGKVD